MEKTTILLIDDEARIRQAFARTLKLAGYAITTAENGEAGLAIFDQEQPDIVLLDLRMPGMDGLTVLQEMRKRDPEANVILATGHGDKDAVIAALRAGASDFLGKPIDHVALESALRRAEERLNLKRKLRASEEALRQQNARLEDEVQARTAELQETLAKYQVLFNAFPLGISVANAAGQILEVNQESERLLGLSQEEHAQREIDGAEWRIIRPDGTSMPPEEYASVRALQEGQVVHNVEMGIVKGPDDVTWISVTAAPLQDNRVVITYNDTTERKLAQDALRESEERQRALLDATEQAFTLLDSSGTILAFNRVAQATAQAVFGFPMRAGDSIKRFVLEDDQGFAANFARAVAGEIVATEKPLPTPDGQTRWFAFTYHPVLEQGQVTGVGFNTIDITEHKQAEDALRESEEKLRRIVENSTNLFYTHTPEHILTYLSPQTRTLLDCEPEEAMIRWTEFATDNPINEVGFALTEKAIATGETQPPYELELVGKRGRKIWVEVRESPVVEDGQTVAIVGSLTDITARKQADDALRESEERFRSLFAASPDAILLAEAETGVIRHANAAAVALFEHPIDRLIGMQYYALHPRQQSEQAQATFTYRPPHPEGEAPPVEIDIVTAQGETKTVEIRGRTIQINGTAYVLGNFRDITARKRAEEALRASESRLSAILRYTPAIIYLKDLEGHFTLINRAFEQAFNVTRDAVLGKTSYDLVPAEMAKEHQAHDAQVIQSGEAHQFEETAIEADGQPHTALSIKFPMYDAEGTLIGLGGISSDITERKQAQASLQRIEWLLSKSLDPVAQQPAYRPPYGDVTELNTCRVILDTVGQDALRRLAEDTIDLLDTSVAVYEKNGDYAFGMFSSGWCQFMDAASRQLCGDVDNRAALTCGCWLCHENCWHDSAQVAIETGQPTDIACVGGIHLYAVPIFAGDEVIGAINIGYGDPPRDTPTLEKLAAAFGVTVKKLETQARAYQTRPAYIVALAKKRLHTIATLIGEIVERKQAEQALRESEERLHRLLNSTQDMVILQDLEGRYLYFNGPERYGIEGDDIAGRTPYDYLPPENAEQMMEKVRHVAAEGEGLISEQRITWQGETLWFSDDVFPVRDEAGRLVAVGIISRNITAIKQVEAALRESERRLDQMLQTLVDGMVRVNTEGKITYANPAAEEILELHRDELLKRYYDERSWRQIDEDGNPYPPERLPVAIALEQQQKVKGNEHGIEASNGERKWLSVNAAPLVNEQGQLYGVVASFRDITERKQMEAQLQEYANHLEQMVNEKMAELERERAKTLQMDKMSTIGQMATGVAHELNQPLTVITLDADYLKTAAQKLKTDPESCPGLLVPEELIKIGENFIDSVRRCRRIVDHLRTFGRVSTGPLAPISLEQPISDSLILTAARLREHGIEVRLNFADDLPPILADSHKLEQVFLNLIANAEYAMEKKERKSEQAKEAKRLEIMTYCEGDDVIATVRDTGCGIPEEVQAHLFEPFYTTKPAGKGTGLGLAISYDIITDFGGEITCESTVGAGTTFTLRFPVADPKETTP